MALPGARSCYISGSRSIDFPVPVRPMTYMWMTYMC
jgi:hypothetical protein